MKMQQLVACTNFAKQIKATEENCKRREEETGTGSFVCMKKQMTFCQESQDRITTKLQDLIENNH